MSACTASHQQVQLVEKVQPVSTIMEPGVCAVADCFIQGVQRLAGYIIVTLPYIGDMQLSCIASSARLQQKPDCACHSVTACQSRRQGALLLPERLLATSKPVTVVDELSDPPVVVFRIRGHDCNGCHLLYTMQLEV